MPESGAAPAGRPGIPETPGARLWRKFLKIRGGKAGLILIAVFLLAALFAPFLAHRLPLYWRDAETGTVSFPLIREFFAPSDTTEGFLEAGINFTLLFLPACLVAWFLMRRFCPALLRRESRIVSLLLGALFSAAVWAGLGGMVVQAGGSDWLTRETPPIPEAGDLDDPEAFNAPPPPRNAVQSLARETAEPRIRGAMEAIGEKAGSRGVRRDDLLAAAVRNVIDGPPIAGVGAVLSAGKTDSRGITDANLADGPNAARWNRILIDVAYPGLLPPFARFRAAFLAAACFSLAALLGLTYIFMTGASQFSLSPAWLVLLALGVLLFLPFTGRPRNDPTPYRQLAAEGRGHGVFPLIPYGPNEQGFGPRLPPDWAVASPLLSAEDIVSPGRLRTLLDFPENAAARHVRDVLLALSGSAAGGGPALLEDAGQTAALLNRAIESDTFYDPEAFSEIRADISLLPYLSAAGSGGTPAPADRLRMNRLLLERTFPSTIDSAPANRWKKPQHLRGRHFLGTDESGRDVLVRVIHGARVSLSVGFVSVALATVIGLVLGSVAAYYGGWVDMAVSRFMELMMCFPSFFLILAVIAVLDRRSILNIMLIIGLTSWTGIARLVRGEMLRQKKMDYVAAAVVLGAPDARIIFRHILPNAMAPVLVSISFGVTGAILTEASLSFIGFGVTPPTPTWGQLLSETRESPLANWWLAVFPGLVLSLGVFAYNLAGEALRDALDPRTTL